MRAAAGRRSRRRSPRRAGGSRAAPAAAAAGRRGRARRRELGSQPRPQRRPQYAQWSSACSARSWLLRRRDVGAAAVDRRDETPAGLTRPRARSAAGASAAGCASRASTAPMSSGVTDGAAACAASPRENSAAGARRPATRAVLSAPSSKNDHARPAPQERRHRSVGIDAVQGLERATRAWRRVATGRGRACSAAVSCGASSNSMVRGSASCATRVV